MTLTWESTDDSLIVSIPDECSGGQFTRSEEGELVDR